MVFIFLFGLVYPRLCDLCFAQKPAKNADTNMNYKNMDKDAPHAFTELDHTTYMATHTPSPWHVLSGWTLQTCVFDFMHSCFLGSAKDFIPSVLRALVEKGCFDAFGCERGSSEMFARITMEIHDTFKENKLPELKIFLSKSW